MGNRRRKGGAELASSVDKCIAMPACMHGMIRATYPAPIMQYSCFAVTGRGAVLISSCLPDESSSPPLALLVVCALHPCVPASQDPRLATSSALDNAATRTANSCKTDAVRKHTTKSDSLLLIFQKKNLYLELFFLYFGTRHF